MDFKILRADMTDNYCLALNNRQTPLPIEEKTKRTMSETEKSIVKEMLKHIENEY